MARIEFSRSFSGVDAARQTAARLAGAENQHGARIETGRQPESLGASASQAGLPLEPAPGAPLHDTG